MNEIKVFAPATVANLSCGYDILGLALEAVGDILQVKHTNTNEIVIKEIRGPGNLSYDINNNICGVIAQHMCADFGLDCGLEMKLTKGVLPGSGMGSSAASSAATVVAIDALYELNLSLSQKIAYAMLGEKLASGTAHADNVAPAVCGGITLVRSYNPLDIISVPYPDDLVMVILHPKIELRTELSRKVLPQQLDIKTATQQWGNVAGFITGLTTADYDLISRSMQDFVVEPYRSVLIPAYAAIKQSAMHSGALGAGISGSGPSVFAMCRGEIQAEKVAKAMDDAINKHQIEHDLYVSKVSQIACKIL